MATTFVSGGQFLAQLAEVLGLGAELPIMSISIDADVADPPTATVTMGIRSDEAKKILCLVQRNQLVPTCQSFEENS